MRHGTEIECMRASTGSTCQAPWSSTSIKSPPSPSGPGNESSSSSTTTLVQRPHSSGNMTCCSILNPTSLHASPSSPSSVSIGDPVSRVAEEFSRHQEQEQLQGCSSRMQKEEQNKKTSPMKRTETTGTAAGGSRSLRSRRRRRSLSLCESFSDNESPDGE